MAAVYLTDDQGHDRGFALKRGGLIGWASERGAGVHGPLRALLPDRRIAVEESRLDGAAADPSGLWPEERAAIALAMPGRRREFAAGRVLARRALERLGIGDVALPVGADRAPVFSRLVGREGRLFAGEKRLHADDQAR